MQKENLHSGHRARMREKLLYHGEDIFDTYELLEMLLYTVIPLADTNPMAKRLLQRFGSLDGVLSASKEELAKVDGVGERCADFLCTVGDIINLAVVAPLAATKYEFSDYSRLLEYSLHFFEQHGEVNIVTLLLDGRLKLIRAVRFEGDMLASGGVKLESFLDAAMSSPAQHIVFILHHKYGALYPTEGEFASLKLLRLRLLEVGVNMLDTLIVGGGKVISVDRLIGGAKTLFSSTTREYQSFLSGKERREAEDNEGK